jgi:hypothetical protein
MCLDALPLFIQAALAFWLLQQGLAQCKKGVLATLTAVVQWWLLLSNAQSMQV